MKPSGFYILLTASVLLLVFFNCLISKDITEWIPSLKEKIGLYILVWFLPVIGFFLANRIGNLGWFSKKQSRSGETAITGGLLGLDEVFNPSTKYVVEAIEEQKSEIVEEQKHSDDNDKNSSKNT